MRLDIASLLVDAAPFEKMTMGERFEGSRSGHLTVRITAESPGVLMAAIADVASALESATGKPHLTVDTEQLSEELFNLNFEFRNPSVICW